MAKKSTAAPAAAAPERPCERCPAPARERHRVDGRWMNLCSACATAHRQHQADRRMAELGLATPEQRRQWLREHPLRSRRFGAGGREPGQDEKEQQS